jgi:hypothetical protein
MEIYIGSVRTLKESETRMGLNAMIKRPRATSGGPAMRRPIPRRARKRARLKKREHNRAPVSGESASSVKTAAERG